MNTRVEPLRAGLAVVTAVAMVATMILLFGSAPALGQQGNPPSVECASPLWNGDYWKVQVNNGTAGGVETNVNEDAILFDSTDVSDGSVTWTNNHEDEDSVFRVVRKEGQDEGDEVINYDPPVPFGESRTITLDSDISHITFCFTDVVATTTTTVAEETTTTLAEETTTTVEDTTTTTIPDEVAGTVITTSTTAPLAPVTTAEVLDTDVEAEELPFTGIDSELLVGMGVLMLMSGLLVLGVTGRREDA